MQGHRIVGWPCFLHCRMVGCRDDEHNPEVNQIFGGQLKIRMSTDVQEPILQHLAWGVNHPEQ